MARFSDPSISFLIIAFLTGLFVLMPPVWSQEDERIDTVIATRANPSEDANIERRLNNIFANLDDLKGIAVDVQDGVVTLTGEVLERRAEERALELAARTANVVSVENRLTYNRDVGRTLTVVSENLREQMRAALQYIPVLAVAVLVFTLFWLFARWMTRGRRFFERLAPNVFIADLLRQLVRVGITLAGLVIALQIADASSILGSVLGALGLAGLALGFAVRDTVENYIASILLSLRQPFAPEDHVIIEGQEGLVLKLTSRATLLMSFDGNHIRIPNSVVYKAVILNFTRNPNRRFWFEIGVGTDVNLIDALELARQTIERSPGVLQYPAPTGQIHALGESNVLLRFYAWMDQRSSDYSAVRSETLRRVKAAFQQMDFDMPEPSYRLRIEAGSGEKQEAPGAREEILRPPTATLESKTGEPVEAVTHTGQSPESAAKVQLDQDLEASGGGENLLSRDAPRE